MPVCRNSRLVSSVSAGNGIRITEPAVLGLSPSSDFIMAFSISGTKDFSYGETDSVRESSIVTDAA